MNNLWLGLQSPWLVGFPPLLIFALRSNDTRAHWLTSARLFNLSFGIAILQIVVQSVGNRHLNIQTEQILLLLVLFLAIVILRFSETYLRGEATQPTYIKLLSLTVACSSLVVTAPRLDALLLAWIAGSVSMNGLLQHYPERRAAQLAAHKKFVVSRLAELCLLTACVLVHYACGTVSLRALGTHVASLPTLPPSLRWATILIVITVLLKTAQVPLHGWLMQVMEAPTPISALLHAGVVNLGGIVLLRVSGLLDKCPPAQWLLVISGGTTLLLAALVAMTRVSIKVRLAWSTCAQMGFLLVECGLGLYTLALLHLLGHSLYKAHAFLTSGNTVQDYRNSVPSEPPRRSLAKVLWFEALVAAASSFFVWSVYRTLVRDPLGQAPDLAPVLIVGLGLAPLLTRGLAQRTTAWAGTFRYLTLLTLYLCWHTLLSPVISDAPHRSPWMISLFGAQLLLLYLLQAVVQQAPQSAWVRSLRRWAFHGFYLDESFTRAVIAQWPAKYRTIPKEPTQTIGCAKEFA